MDASAKNNGVFWLADWTGGWTRKEGEPVDGKQSGWRWVYTPTVIALSRISSLNASTPTWGNLSVNDLATRYVYPFLDKGSLHGITVILINSCSPLISSWEGYKAKNYSMPYGAVPLLEGLVVSGDADVDWGPSILTPGAVNLTICPLSSVAPRAFSDSTDPTNPIWSLNF